MRRNHSKIKVQQLWEHKGRLKELWNSFWLSPEVRCPKCNCELTEYYDPFFFAPLRTLKGRRRIKCTSCRFVWRPSRNTKTVWDILNPFG
jgi:hypothetical protein